MLFQLIKARWIIFEVAPNMSTNPLPNDASGNRLVNALEVKYPRSLKVLMNRVYEMMKKVGYKESSYEGLTSMNFCKYHSEESHMINQCKGFYNKVKQMMIQ
jgi:hypothetical protein